MTMSQRQDAKTLRRLGLIQQDLLRLGGFALRLGESDMATEVAAKQKVGKVVQVIGPVVDIQFEDGHLPDIYSAVHIASDGTGGSAKLDIICEVEQHLGEARVRTVAMKPTDGMQRGMKAVDLGEPILDARRSCDARPCDERARRAGRLSRPAGEVEGALGHPSQRSDARSSSRPS